MNFTYEARNMQGGFLIRGDIAATDRETALTVIKKQGLLVIKLQEKKRFFAFVLKKCMSGFQKESRKGKKRPTLRQTQLSPKPQPDKTPLRLPPPTNS